MTKRRRRYPKHRRSWKWRPRDGGGAELNAAAEAIALCNTPQGQEMQLWIRLCWLRDDHLPWTEILPALQREIAAALPIAAE